MKNESRPSAGAKGGYHLSMIDSHDDLPARENVTAVFLVGFVDGKVVAARNERGWDIPGGHLEADEELLEGLRREVQEEAGASFQEAVPFASISMSDREEAMVFFTSDHCRLAEFVPQPDALERSLLKPARLLRLYHGDRGLMARLLSLAEDRLR